MLMETFSLSLSASSVNFEYLPEIVITVFNLDNVEQRINSENSTKMNTRVEDKPALVNQITTINLTSMREVSRCSRDKVSLYNIYIPTSGSGQLRHWRDIARINSTV